MPVVENGGCGKVWHLLLQRQLLKSGGAADGCASPMSLALPLQPTQVGSLQRAAAQLHPGEMLQASPYTSWRS